MCQPNPWTNDFGEDLLLLQATTSRRVFVWFDDVMHACESEISSVCPAHFLAEYFAEALQVFASLCKFLQHLFHFILHERTALISCSYVGRNNFQCDVTYVILSSMVYNFPWTYPTHFMFQFQGNQGISCRLSHLSVCLSVCLSDG